MVKFTFPCLSCQQRLEAPARLAGLYVECPACHQVIQVPMTGDPVEEAVDLHPAAPENTPEAPGKKKDTIPIDLPPNLGVPMPRHRHIVIRRAKQE